MLVMVFTSVALWALTSFSTQTRIRVADAKGGKESLGAELAAQSGLEFGLTQLLADANWLGAKAISVGSGEFFTVTRTDIPTGRTFQTAELLIDGFRGDSMYRIEAAVDVIAGSPLLSSGLVLYGGMAEVHNSTFTGDVTIADDPSRVWDWDPVVEDWVPSGLPAVKDFKFTSNEGDGTLFKYTDRVYSGWDDQFMNHTDMYMPAYDFSEYTTPGDDRTILKSPGDLVGITSDKTLVVVLDPGERITMRDCDLRGGLVVVTDGVHDVRDGALTEVQIMHSNTIGGGDKGIHPNIGFMAPFSQVTGRSGIPNNYYGLSMWNGADTNVDLTIDGQLLVFNEVANLNFCKINWNSAVTSDPPLGIVYNDEPPSVDVTMVREEQNEESLGQLQ